MKLKYYLRGLGIGVLVTAIILHFILGDGTSPMTDEQVKARAKELGMTESMTLSQAASSNTSSSLITESSLDEPIGQSPEPITLPTAEPSDQPTSSPSAMPTASPSVSMGPTATPSPSVSPSPSPSPSPSAKPSASPSASPNSGERLISITVSNGDGSYAVAKKVMSAGLVESAAEFDEYLCNNGYDKILSTGTHKIKENSTYEEIAKALSGR